MTKLLRNTFKVHSAKQLKESITEASGNDYYIFAGRHLPWTDDSNPPVLTDTERAGYFDPFSQMVFGKLVTSNDVKHAIRRISWVSGTAYTMYDDTVDLTEASYYVVVDDVDGQRSVFKCIDNNNGALSTQKPSVKDLGGKVGASNYSGIYKTSADGYVWKYMGGIEDTVFDKFATDSYVPYDVNANVATNAVDGSIEAIKVVSGGIRYDARHEGYIQVVAYNGDQTVFGIGDTASTTNDFYTGSGLYIKKTGEIRKIVDYTVFSNPTASVGDYDYNFKKVTVESAFDTLPSKLDDYEIVPYVTIKGDGTGAVAKAVMDTTSNTISQVIVLNKGSGYSYSRATATNFTAVAGAANASLRVVTSPQGGHGADQINELDGSSLFFTVEFANNENSTISVTNDYRQVGLIRDPLYANLEFAVTAYSPAASRFTDNDTNYVVGSVSGANGVVSGVTGSSSFNLSDVSGIPTTSDTFTEYYANGSATGVTATVTGISSHGSRQTINNGTFDQTLKLGITYVTSTSGGNVFRQDDHVTQGLSALLEANGYVQEVTSSYITLTGTEGVWQTSDQATGGDFLGEVELYDVENDPLGRNIRAEVDSTIYPDLKKNSGDILYVENVQPVIRSGTQTETISLLFKF